MIVYVACITCMCVCVCVCGKLHKLMTSLSIYVNVLRGPLIMISLGGGVGLVYAIRAWCFLVKVVNDKFTWPCIILYAYGWV